MRMSIQVPKMSLRAGQAVYARRLSGGGRPVATPGTVAGGTQPAKIELFFGVISPAGTNTDKFIAALTGLLIEYGFRVERIKLSTLLIETIRFRDPSKTIPEEGAERISTLITEGDNLCEELDMPSAIAALGVTKIRSLRKRSDTSSTSRQESWIQNTGEERGERVAYIFDSLKRSVEVTKLREIYCDHLLIFSLDDSRARREKRMVRSFQHVHPASDAREHRQAAEELIERDNKEPGNPKYGQDSATTYPLADVFIEMKTAVRRQVRRVLRLLFDSPIYPVPTRAEYAMSVAALTTTKSAELGTKIAAAITTRSGELVATGANVHPRHQGAPRYDEGFGDLRALVVDTLRRLSNAQLIPEEKLLKNTEGSHGRGSIDRLANSLLVGELAQSRIREITEYMRPVHGEMNALLNAMLAGVQVNGGTIYVTAYPCHNCAKHLISLDMQIQYLEPYSKSRTQRMYGDDSALRISRFIGIAPRSYDRLFQPEESNRKSSEGARNPEDLTRAQPKVSAITAAGIQEREMELVKSLEDALGNHPRGRSQSSRRSRERRAHRGRFLGSRVGQPPGWRRR